MRLCLCNKRKLVQWESNAITLVALDKADQVNFSSPKALDPCNSLLNMFYQSEVSTLFSAA